LRASEKEPEDFTESMPVSLAIRGYRKLSRNDQLTRLGLEFFERKIKKLDFVVKGKLKTLTISRFEQVHSNVWEIEGETNNGCEVKLVCLKVSPDEAKFDVEMYFKKKDEGKF